MASSPQSPAVVVHKLRRDFGARSVLRDIDFSIAPGEFVALLGPSGCGKSTLLRSLLRLDRQSEASVQVPQRRAVVFQEPRLLPWKRVLRNVSLGLPGSARATQQAATAALEEVGLADHRDAWPVTLSGGEAQRVALARALVRQPELLLLDEPFGALDALTRLKMHELLSALWRKHRPAVLLVTHDVDEAIALADRALVLGSPAAGSGNTIVAELEIDLPRPRRRRDPRFAELRRSLLVELGVVADDTHAQPAAQPAPATAHALPALATLPTHRRTQAQLG